MIFEATINPTITITINMTDNANLSTWRVDDL